MQSVALSTPPKVRVSESIGTCGGALVTGADYRGLGIVRSLGRRGIPVWVMKQDGQVLGAASRYASRSLSSPSSEESRKQLDFLVNLATKEGVAGWAVFPTSDETVVLIARHHRLLSEYYRLTTAPWKVLRWGCDKRLLYRLAEDLGVNRPWTFCPRNRDELAALECPFPVILKPAMRLGFNRLTRDKAWRVENRASLLARYDEACKLLAPELIMVQELLPGGGESQFSYAALCRDGLPLASVVARRARQFPMDFGRFSTYVETIDEPQLVEPSVRLLAAMGFNGLVEVEFKKDSRDGKFKVLDVNPRVWGWHTLCGRAGVDFPHLAWLLVRGEPIPNVRARAGERWVRLGADLSVSIQEILSGRLSLRSYLKSLRGSFECSMFAWDDLLPGLLGLPLVVATLGKRVLSGKAA
jgi:predicted ATP-grasp superfamily ATP-dependent carboligase